MKAITAAVHRSCGSYHSGGDVDHVVRVRFYTLFFLAPPSFCDPYLLLMIMPAPMRASYSCLFTSFPVEYPMIVIEYRIKHPSICRL